MKVLLVLHCSVKVSFDLSSLVMFLVRSFNGGISSSYSRSNDISSDMPLNNDVLVIPLGYSTPQQGEGEPFKPYTHWHYVPFEDSGSTSSLWYSIKRASANIIVMSSCSAYGKTIYRYI